MGTSVGKWGRWAAERVWPWVLAAAEKRLARQTSPAKFLVATCITNERVSALLAAHCAMKGVTPPMPCMRVACAVVLRVNALCNMQY